MHNRTVIEDKATADVAKEENTTTIAEDEAIVGHCQEGMGQSLTCWTHDGDGWGVAATYRLLK